jgi:hypothetical protein
MQKLGFILTTVCLLLVVFFVVPVPAFALYEPQPVTYQQPQQQDVISGTISYIFSEISKGVKFLLALGQGTPAKTTDNLAATGEEEAVLAAENSASSDFSKRISDLETAFAGFNSPTLSLLNATGENILRNSSFEASDGGPRQWQYQLDSNTGNTVRSLEAVRSGAYGFKFQGGGAGNFGISQPESKTIPGRTYTFSSYIKVINAPAITVQLGFWDEYNNKYATRKDFTFSGTKEWSRISMTVTTPGLMTDPTNWFPIVQIYGLTSGSVYIDDAVLGEGNILTNFNSQVAKTGGNIGLGDGSILFSPAGDLYPAQSGVGSLGSSNNKWNALTLSGNATVGGTLNVSGDTVFNGDLAVNGGDLTTTATTFNLLNTNASIINFGGAGTTIAVGGGSGTTTLSNNLTVNLVDNNVNALDIQQGTDNYININTTDAVENVAFGNAITNPTFNFLGTGAVAIAGLEGSTELTLTAGDAVISDGSLAVTDDDNAASFTTTNNTATTVGAAAAGGVNVLSSTSLTTGDLLELQLTEAALTTGAYLRAWDVTGGASVFSVGEDGLTTIAGAADGTDALVLTLGDILVSNGDVDISGGDFNVTLDAGDGAGITNAGSTIATGALAVSNTTAAANVGNAIGQSVALALTDYADDATADTRSGLDVTVTNNASDAGADDNIYGLVVNNLGGAAQADGTEYAIYQAGTGWDLGLKIEDAVDIDGSANISDTTAGADVTMGNSTGNLTFISDNADFTLTNGTDDIFQLRDGTRNYLDIDLGATDTVTLGNATDVTAILGSATSSIGFGTAFTVAATTGLTTIAGAADGTDALVLTLGDILVTDGDLTLSGGDLDVTLDAGNGASITEAAGAGGADALTVTATPNSDSNTDALAVLLTQEADGGNAVNIAGAGIDMNLTDSGEAGDIMYGLTVGVDANGSVGALTAVNVEALTAGAGAETAIAIGAGWDTGISLGANSIVGTTGDINYSNFDVNGTTGKTDWILGAAGQLTVDAATTDNTTTDGVIKVTQDSTASGIGLNIDSEVIDDNAVDTQAGIKVTMTNSANDSDVVYGLSVAELGGAASGGTEYAIYQAGTAWDYGLYVTDDAYFGDNVSVTDDLALEGIVDMGTLDSMADNDLTPSVVGSAMFSGDANGDTVTKFDDAVAGQVWVIKHTGATTFDCDNTDAGADDLQCGLTDIVTAAGDSTVWYSDGTQSFLVNWLDESDTQTGADVAEWMKSTQNLSAGTVVVAHPSEKETVVRSEQEYDSRVIGIVSDVKGTLSDIRPGLLLGDDRTGNTPVALAGRVMAKFDGRNGAAQPGDALTSAPDGKLMKALKAGPTVGKALGSDESGLVLILVNIGWFDPAEVSLAQLDAVSERIALLEALSKPAGEVLGAETTVASEVADTAEVQATVSEEAPELGVQETASSLLVENRLTATELSVTKLAVFGGDIKVTGLAEVANLTVSGGAKVGGTLEIGGAVVIAATAAEDLKAGDAVRVSSANEVRKADSTDAARALVLGLATGDVKAGDAVKVAVGGRVGGYENLAVGKAYFLGTNGKLVTGAPENAVRVVQVGLAISETDLIVQITTEAKQPVEVEKVVEEAAATPVSTATVADTSEPTPTPTEIVVETTPAPTSTVTPTPEPEVVVPTVAPETPDVTITEPVVE